MACNWIYKDNKITGVKGNPPIFKELEEKFGLEEAINLYAVSQSDSFQEIFGEQKIPGTTFKFKSQKEFEEVVKSRTWGMLTAENPNATQLSEVENLQRNREAEQWLKEKSYKFLPIKGKYGNEENSYFVKGLTFEDAVEFAKIFEQESVATNEGLVYQDGSYNPIEKGKEEFDGQYEDYFSTIKIDDKNVTFTISYDFEKKDYKISPNNSTNYSNLTEDNQGNFVFYHVGDRGYETIKKGTGQNITTSREEATAINRVGGLAMYYPAENVGETMITNNAKYIVKVPKNKVYDFNADPLNFLDQAEELFRKEYPTQAFDTNSQLAFVTKVANEKGFDAVVAKWKDTTRVQTTKELKPVDSQLLEGNTVVKDFSPKNKLKSNKEKGWKVQEGETQMQVLAQVYKNISDAVGNDYSNPLYRLREMSGYTFEDRFAPFKSQDEITNAIQNSNLPQNLKDAYSEALTFSDAQGYSFLEETFSVEDIVNFVTAENENKNPITKEQKADFRNMLKDIPNFNKQSFIDAFYVDGLFIITDKLQPFYSRYEVQNLKNDVELQAKVKNAVEALKNTEEEIEATVEQIEKINEINSFGKLTNYNPQKEIQEALAGIQDREEFEETLNNLPFPNFLRTVNRDELFEKMSAMQRVEVYSELNGQIVPQPQEFVEPLLALKKEEIDFELVDNIDFILQAPQELLEANEQQAASILEEIVEQGANSAIDLQGLTLDKPFLEELRLFILGSNPNFVEAYKTFFNKNQEVKTAVKKIKKEEKDYVELNTTLTEEEVYNQQGLIRAKDNLWIKTAKQPLEELYPIMETYNPNIREEIQTQIAQLEGFNNAETAEAVMLYKNYFGVSSEGVNEGVKAITEGVKNYEYLTTDFLKDFYAKMLKERNKNSATWKNFYSNFGINERGLYLNTEDLETIKDYADENLKQYSLISKQLPNLIETETEIVNRRDEAINNPQTVNKFEGQIFSIPTGEIIIKDSVEEFVKIGEDIYENVDVQGNLSLYTKLPKNSSPYYKVGEKQIETVVKLSDYSYLQNKTDKFTTVKNYLTKEEKENINDDFIC